MRRERRKRRSFSSIVPSPPGKGIVMGLQGTRLPLAPEAGASRRRRRRLG